jgi:TPR repeat protein
MRSIGLFLSWLCLLPAAVFAEDGKRFAVLVGVNSYEHPKLPKLNFAVNDAVDLAKLLREDGYIVTELTDSSETKPTRQAIADAISNVLKKAGKDDSVLIALSGHGLQFDKDAYFCPSDAKPFAEEHQTLIALDGIYKQMDQSVAAVKMLLVDACRNDPDPARGVSKGIDAGSAPVPPQGALAMFSCSAQQKSFEDPDRQHGVFFHYVIEGLRGKAINADGEVTFALLNDYVARRVDGRVKELFPAQKQTPNMVARVVGASPVLVNAEDAKLAEELRNHDLFLRGSKDFFDMHRHRFEMWEKAAKRENPNAMVLVAKRAQFGHEQPRNLARATELLKKAVAAGSPSAMHALALLARDKQVQQQFALPSPKEAIELMEKAARLGHGRSCFNLGMFYKLGDEFLTQDYRKAMEFFQRAGEAGYAPGWRSIGLMYRNGEGFPKDEKLQTVYFLKAAEMGDPNAMCDVGYAYEMGIGIDKNPEKAVEWYTKGAALNHGLCCSNLGNCYSRGFGTAKNERKSFELFQKSAELKSPFGTRKLGFAYLTGVGTEKNEVEAFKCFKQAAELGDATAIFKHGQALRYGWGGTTKNIDESIAFYLKAAEKGNDFAMHALGVAYRDGVGVAKNPKTSFEWFLKSAKAGHAFGMRDVGHAYTVGLGVEKNEAEAAAWFEKGVDQDDDYCMYRLAWMHLKSIGVKNPSAKTGAALMERAAKKDHLNAMNDTGICYRNGTGVEKNDTMAAFWYERAASKGSSHAQYNFAFLLERGEGVTKNIPKAIEFYEKAAAQKDADAIKALQRLKPNP